MFWSAEKCAAKDTTHFVIVADAMARQYLEAGIGRANLFTKISSGFNVKPFLSAANDPNLRLELGIAPEDIVVGKVARLCDLKGHAVAAGIGSQAPGNRLRLRWRA